MRLKERRKKHITSDTDDMFLRRFQDSYLHLRNKTLKEWNRDLPFFELFVDRWERSRRLNFGRGTSIYQSSYVYGDVKVGKNTWIGPFSILDGTGGLIIGDFCSISAGVQIYSHDSIDWALSGGKKRYRYKKVKIGSYCYVGPQAVISKGVTIGHHCLIGALTLVNNSFPPFSIICGVPAKIIGKVQLKNNKVKFIY